MRLFGHEFGRRAKTLVILAAVLLVSAGMCGLQIYSPGSGGLRGLIYVRLPLGLLELAAMFISACWIVILLIAWGAEALHQRYSKASTGQVRKLFEDKDDEERKDPR